MFEIQRDAAGVIHFKGMFVAGKSKTAEEILDGIDEDVVLDFSALKYISSSGLGLLIKVQRRLDASGHKVKIINSSDHIRELFTVTRFDLIFDIE
jgi:anti-sigma B factor antagonist